MNDIERYIYIYLESEFFQTDSQARSWFVSGSGFRNDGKSSGRAVGVPGSDLDAGNVQGLVGERRGRGGGGSSSSVPTALGKLGAGLLSGSELCAPRQSFSSKHYERGGECGRACTGWPV